jgi:hypothetical protein
MFAKLMDTVFGCWHSHYSFPITVRSAGRRSQAAAVTGTYVVCLDCGKELPYDWRQMRIVSPEPASRAASFVTKEAA